MGVGVNARDNWRRVPGPLAEDLQRNPGINTGTAPGVAQIMDTIAFRDTGLLAQFFEEADRPGQLVVVPLAGEHLAVAAIRQQLANHRLSGLGQVDHARPAGLLGRQEPRTRLEIEVTPLQGARLAQAGAGQRHQHQHA